ncbi:hypothetical protein KOR42_32850 [Thalassoglobus neptunius]|uniref:Uncharacterized protein n=1 Tax=Thalassoglobus neptunius TaxID=1938619 RepID=A0A5C5WPN2_9PLAN|nr:AAA family ATPase [Thalassoglobus neptunius]TWT51812.1 hypothetical protein KOR42_32850 [Thalassoglobus neptunius]
MSYPVLILGESGAGKSSSLRNLDPIQCLLLQVLPKPLPFPSQGWEKFQNSSGSIFQTDNPETIQKGIESAARLGRDIVIVDDFQYLMANEFMRRSSEKGFDKFTEIGRKAWDTIQTAINLPEPIRVYFLWHVETSQEGKLKAKTIGKMLDEKVTIEGMFSIVLRSFIDPENRAYRFATQSNGFDPVKTPWGMFQESTIENDLSIVERSITSFYGIRND